MGARLRPGGGFKTFIYCHGFSAAFTVLVRSRMRSATLLMNLASSLKCLSVRFAASGIILRSSIPITVSRSSLIRRIRMSPALTLIHEPCPVSFRLSYRIDYKLGRQIVRGDNPPDLYAMACRLIKVWNLPPPNPKLRKDIKKALDE